MATFELEESDFAGYMEDGSIWPAKVISVKVVEKPYFEDDGVTKVRKVEFKFEIIDNVTGQFNEVNVWGETPTKFNTHPECKLRNWASAILGMPELPVGYRLETDVLQGNTCRVNVELYEYEDKKGPKDPATGKGFMKQRNRVVDIMPSAEAMANISSHDPSEEPF
jgi:hypothetical protein